MTNCDDGGTRQYNGKFSCDGNLPLLKIFFCKNGGGHIYQLEKLHPLLLIAIGISRPRTAPNMVASAPGPSKMVVMPILVASAFTAELTTALSIVETADIQFA